MPRFVLAAALLPAAASGQSAVPPRTPPPPLVVDASPDRPVFAGSLTVRTARRAERVELLIAAHAQSSRDENTVATTRLAQLVRDAVGRGVTSDPWTEFGKNMFSVNGGPYAGLVRVALPAPVDDAKVRDAIDRIMTALNRLDWHDPASSGRIVSVGRVFASCQPFETLSADAARDLARSLAQPLGDVHDAQPSLRDQTFEGLRIDGPAPDAPVCGLESHPSRPTAVDRAPSASFAVRRAFGFAERMRFAPVRPQPDSRDVLELWAGPSSDPRLRLRSSGALLTLEGHATIAHHAAGTFYDYHGPNGRHFRSSVTTTALGATRSRLRALGIADSAITTLLDPAAGSWYVSVRTASPSPDDAVVTAIAGASPFERRAVQAITYEDDCAALPSAIAQALADAAARAYRIAARLGGSADIAHPMAVVLEHGTAMRPCAPNDQQLFTEPIARHASGTLRTVSAHHRDVEELAVMASFPIGVGALRGRIESPDASDDPNSFMVRFGFVPPPVEYPDASLVGDARLEKRLPPQHVRIGVELSPDNANAFKPIDARFPAALAAQLGAGDADYTASFVPSSLTNGPNGDPVPDALSFVAVVPYRGAATIAAATAALHSLYSVGYAGLDIVPQRDDCRDAADALGADAIRAAALRAHAPKGARLIAVDLRGPYTADGTCHAGPGGVQNWSVREVHVPDVRLAAYARVSYARP